MKSKKLSCYLVTYTDSLEPMGTFIVVPYDSDHTEINTFIKENPWKVDNLSYRYVFSGHQETKLLNNQMFMMEVECNEKKG